MKGPKMQQEKRYKRTRAVIMLAFYILAAFWVKPVFATAVTDSTLRIKEEDGSPSKTPHTLKVTNGTLTDNGDGTVSLNTGGGGGGSGDAVTVNTTAVDTTANFKDTASVTWAVVDGGAGGPDDVQATAILANAATALAADPANCASSGLAGGINAAGTAEACVTPGTGVATALAVNVGTAGAFVVNGGALGTPSSGTLTNATGLPLAGTLITAGDSLTITGDDIDFDGGASPGGELGNTWASPTIDDSVTVTGWELGASTATTPSASDNDTSLATTAYVQTEFAYREFDLSPAGMILDDTAPPDLIIVESTGTGTARRLVADFDPTTDQFGYWTFVAPSDTNSGNILLDIQWFTNDTGANEDAIWYAKLSCTTEGDADSMAEDAVGTANTASENCNATEANRLITTQIALSNTDSIAAGDVCTLVIGRDADDSIGDADNDGLSSDARFVNVHVRIPRI